MSFDWKDYRGNLEWLENRTIFLTRHGSHAYGTNIEGSDEDFKGICIAPLKYYLGNLNHFEQADKGFGDTDCSIYDIKKFFELATKCNPNIIEVLHTDPSDWQIPTADEHARRYTDMKWNTLTFERIYEKRHLFISKLARHTFSGYAMAQLKRIKTHRRWLLDPPKKLPTRSDFGLPDAPTLDRDQLNAVCSEVDKLADRLGGEGFTRDRVTEKDENLVEQVTKKHDIDSNLIEVIVNERRFRNAMTNWRQYQEWKEGRNEKRAALEAQFGYDTKHAMHLVRLMRMATEILDTGIVLVKRPDAEELLAIRRGTWSFDKLMEWATEMDEKLDEAYKLSKLPHGPDREALDTLLCGIIEDYNT